MESIRPVNINLDLAKESYNNILLKQGDTTKLIFTIYENGVITNLSSNSFSIIFTKPDGTIVNQTSGFDTTQAGNGIVSVVLLADCLRIAGSGTIELEIKDANNNRVSSFVIFYSIKQTGLEGVPSSNQAIFIEDIENELTAIQNTEANIVTAETARNLFEAYDNTHSYVQNNKVAYQGNSYVNILACIGVVPTNTNNWLLIAQKGEQGIQGSQGIQGVAGEQGVAGYGLEDNINYSTVVASSNIYTLDLNNKEVSNFEIETTDAVAKTIAFSNVASTIGKIYTVSVKLKYTNAAAITYPSVSWQNSSAPSFVAGKVYLLLFVKYGSGSWYASSVGAWA